jgi:hypothetical protein
MRWRKLEYLVKWKGYGCEENSWIGEGDMDTPELIKAFHRAHLNAPK